MVLPGRGDFRAEEKTCRNCGKSGVDLLVEGPVEAWVENKQPRDVGEPLAYRES